MEAGGLPSFYLRSDFRLSLMHQNSKLKTEFFRVFHSSFNVPIQCQSNPSCPHSTRVLLIIKINFNPLLRNRIRKFFWHSSFGNPVPLQALPFALPTSSSKPTCDCDMHVTCLMPVTACEAATATCNLSSSSKFQIFKPETFSRMTMRKLKVPSSSSLPNSNSKWQVSIFGFSPLFFR